MKKKLIVIVSILFIGASIWGCTQKAANSSEAIQAAQAKQTVDQKVSYLVSQANAFVSSKEFDEAIKTAQYILSNLDKDSAAAQSIIEKAKAEMQKAAQAAVSDVKDKLPSF